MSKMAFVYPGQGAQVIGMGQDFYNNSELAKKVYEDACEVTGLDLKALCFEDNDKLDITEYTQAALVTTCLAMTSVYMNKTGVKPDITAGLSLGEYCAISAAGGLAINDAIMLTRERGILMEHAVPNGEGTMSAILGMDGEKIENVLRDIEGADIANYNCPGQIVITGETSAVETANQALKEAGAKRCIMLKVSGPFHSPMLKNAGKKLREKFDKVSFKSLDIPYVANVTAEKVSDISKTKELLEHQVSSPVRWEQSIRNMIEMGVDTFVEIGPGKTLNGFIRKIDRNVRVINISKWEDMEHE
ncbi:MAG: ACP S-malonyltransferase [Suipraeoptans sp.]